MEQIEFDLGLPEEPPQNKQIEPNGMCRKYGYGPENATCKTCYYLVKKQHERDPKTYWYKCSLQKTGNGCGPDIRLKYKACRKYAKSLITRKVNEHEKNSKLRR